MVENLFVLCDLDASAPKGVQGTVPARIKKESRVVKKMNMDRQDAQDKLNSKSVLLILSILEWRLLKIDFPS